MLIAIAPKLLAATRVAMTFWAIATHNEIKFQEVSSCALPEALGAECVSVSEAKDLGSKVGMTFRYERQYIVLTVAPDPAVLVHELAHCCISMRYHSAPNTSLLSPAVGQRCLTKEDSDIYARTHRGHPLKLMCLK